MSVLPPSRPLLDFCVDFYDIMLLVAFAWAFLVVPVSGDQNAILSRKQQSVPSRHSGFQAMSSNPHHSLNTVLGVHDWKQSSIMGGRQAANARSPTPVREPETPRPEFTRAGVVQKKGKDNLAVIRRYGMVREDQWEDRKQLLEDGELHPAGPDGPLKLDQRVQQRLENICTQLAAVRDLLNLEDQNVVKPVVTTLSSAVKQLWTLTGEVTGDNPDDLSSPVVPNSS